MGKRRYVLSRWVAELRTFRRSSFWRWIGGIVITLLVVWWLAQDLDWAAVLTALQQADYRWVLVGVAAIVGTAWTRAWRWQALLGASRVHLVPTLTALLVGQAANLVLPLRGGDVVRAMWIAPEGEPGPSEALGSVALEKVWDLIALLLCGLLLLVLMPLPGWFLRSTWGTGLTLAVGLPLLWAALRWQERLFCWVGRLLAHLPGGWEQAILPRLQRVALGLDSIRHADASTWAFVWTLLTWGLGGLANWAVMAAFGVRSAGAALFLLVALMVGGSVVPTPGRLGIYEGICVVSLALFGVGRDQALAIGLVLHAVVMGPPLVMAGILTLVPAWSRKGEYGTT